MADIQLHKLIIDLKNSFQSPESGDKIKWNLLDQYFCQYDSNTFSAPKSAHYSVLVALLDALKPNIFSERSQEQLFDDVFLKGVRHDAFMVLVRHLDKSSPSYQQDKIISLLEKFLQGSNLESMILYQCISTDSWNLKYVSSSNMWNDLNTLIISLPERIANKTKGLAKNIFCTSFYIPLLTSAVWKVLTLIYENISNSQDCSLEYIGKLIGRLCLAGYARIVVRKLTLELINVCEPDFIWRRVAQNLITKIPASSLESFVTEFLLIVTWYGYVDCILGDEGIKNQKLNHIICVKLLFMRHFKENLILQNIIGYLASSSTREDEFVKVLLSLLNAWSDGSVLKYQSYSQQYYLAAALMICSGWLKQMKDISHIEGLMIKTLHGVEIRLGSSEASIRSLGMLVGENLVSLDPAAPKLDFEQDTVSDDLIHLKDLLDIPVKPEKELVFSMNELKCFEEVENEKKLWKETDGHDEQPVPLKEELDSDDDLEPYDMSNDVPAEDTKRPLYLRDCLLGLIDQEKPDWTEQCLKHAESLIKANSETVHEIAVEMTKVLLHLDDKFSTTDFVGQRHRAMIALIVQCPQQVAEYLTSQFYERDYNIRQRLDILEILGSASQELSQLKLQTTKPQYPKKEFSVVLEQNWKAVVDQRIQSKTRYITKGPAKPPMLPQENKFSPVAGYFFFPLLEKYDKVDKLLNLNYDSYILGRLLNTLGIVMHASANIPLARQMGHTFFKFLVAVRNNTDVFVRQAAIFATATIYLNVPSFILLTELMEDAMESHAWLKSIIEKDSDINCQIKATQAYSIMLTLMKQEMSLLDDIMKS